MSSTVRSYGVIGVLINPVVDENDALYELGEKLWDDKSPMVINSEGTLAYLDFNRHADWRERENIYGMQIKSLDFEAEMKNRLIQEAEKYDLKIDPDTICSYNCIWYNGGDSDMDMLTKEKFLQKIKSVS